MTGRLNGDPVDEKVSVATTLLGLRGSAGVNTKFEMGVLLSRWCLPGPSVRSFLPGSKSRKGSGGCVKGAAVARGAGAGASVQQEGTRD